MTAIGLMALSSARTRSRFPSVTPCHWLRKFLRMTAGIPDVPGEAGGEEGLSGPDRPADDVTHGENVGPSGPQSGRGAASRP